MSRILLKSYIASILITSLVILGCSSDDGGGGGTTVPSGAVVITEANAHEVAVTAISGATGLINVIPVAANIDQELSPMEIVDLVVDKIKNMQGSFISDIPSGVAIEPIPCSGGGNITGDVTQTATTESGTIIFNSCVEAGITINGTITYSASIDAASNWTLAILGNLSASDGVDTMSLNGLDFKETGNDISAEFSINTYEFAVDFTGGGGFLVQLQAPIVGNEAEFCPTNPRSGIVLITGANNTRSRATINTGGTVTIAFDDGSGTFTEVTVPPPGSPYPCTDFFI